MSDTNKTQTGKDDKQSSGMGYGRFAAMITTSTIVMFGLMYLNTFLITHVFWSETRVYMAILMGASMAIIMLAFMLSMYPSKLVNSAIFIGAAVVFAGSLWLVRSQVTVGDTSFMRAMIPHHSIAIMTSSRAELSDPRVRKLADEIIYAQDKEIAEMRYLVSDIEAHGDGEETQSAPAKLVSVEQALSTANIAILDPEFITSDEMSSLYAGGAACTFNYTTQSPAVLAFSDDGTALIKISGDLIQLDAEADASAADGWQLGADGITVTLSAPDGEPALSETAEEQEADLILNLDAGLRAGFRGYVKCAA